MELKKLTVHNYKSLVNFELNEPNAFTVFAGPNGAGKSNIFEALEFGKYHFSVNESDVEKMFGSTKQFTNFNTDYEGYKVAYNFEKGESSITYLDDVKNNYFKGTYAPVGLFFKKYMSDKELIPTDYSLKLQKLFF